MREKLLDPTGTAERAVDTTLSPAAKPARADRGPAGERQAERGGVLTETGRELRDRYGIRDFKLFRKSYFGHPVEESLIQRILHSCDFAVAAIGD